ncbi:hypothetical protein GCM10027162_54600 [Streptomyces incanus]
MIGADGQGVVEAELADPGAYPAAAVDLMGSGGRGGRRRARVGMATAGWGLVAKQRPSGTWVSRRRSSSAAQSAVRYRLRSIRACPPWAA